MRLLHEQRLDTCLLSQNFCDFSQFPSMKTFQFAYALIITKNCPPFFLFLAALVGIYLRSMNIADQNSHSQRYMIIIMIITNEKDGLST